jgi:hypothetical protein
VTASRPPLQPLRVPPGWRMAWNTWFELEPTAENVRAGYFGGSSLLMATDDARRLYLDLEWRPEDDPAGEFVLTVHYTPWLRTERGRRRKGVPADRSTARLVFEFRTRDRVAAVREVEAALVGRPEWQEPS